MGDYDTESGLPDPRGIITELEKMVLSDYSTIAPGNSSSRYIITEDKKITSERE
jgi:hypothetical protein